MSWYHTRNILKRYELVTDPALDTVWTRQQEVVSDAEEELSNQTLDHLVNEEQNVLRTRPLNLDYKLLITENKEYNSDLQILVVVTW